MKVQFKSDCAVKGTHYDQGEVADFDEGLANHLIGLGRAQKADAKARAGKGEVDNRDPEGENRDPSGKKK